MKKEDFFKIKFYGSKNRRKINDNLIKFILSKEVKTRNFVFLLIFILGFILGALLD